MIKTTSKFLPLCALMLSACSNEEISDIQPPNPSLIAEKNIKEISKANHIKPGAAIDFIHSYGGKSLVGQLENIQLSFTESYGSGQMRVMLDADQELNLNAIQQDFIFNMDSQQPHEIEISVEPQTEGKYYLNIFTSALTYETQQPKTRAFAIAFYVGDHREKQSRTDKPSSENIIILPSQEITGD